MIVLMHQKLSPSALANTLQSRKRWVSALCHAVIECVS